MDDITTDLIEEFLSTRGCTLYGRFFDISDDTGRAECARWMLENMEAISEFAQEGSDA